MFQQILVPVDFTENTEVAVSRALDLADPAMCTITLLHVAASHWGKRIREQDEQREVSTASIRLRAWKKTITDHDTHLKVQCILDRSNQVQGSIETHAKRLGADLVVIGKRSGRHWLRFMNTVIPSDLSRNAGCAVLTARPGVIHQDIRHVVLPVDREWPREKMHTIASLCQHHPVKLFIVACTGLEDIPEQYAMNSLLKVYQWLRTTLHCQMEYAVLQGDNAARSIIDFAEKKQADILVLNQPLEARLDWRGHHLPDLLPAASGMQVLTI